MSKNTAFLTLLAFCRALGPVRVWFATTPVTMMAVTCRSIYRCLADSGCCLGDRFQVSPKSPRNHHVSLFTCLLLSACNNCCFKVEVRLYMQFPMDVRIGNPVNNYPDHEIAIDHHLVKVTICAISRSAQRNESNVSPYSCLHSQNSTGSGI